MAEWTQLTKQELSVFDPEMTDLILEMTEAGWIGRLSSKGHAIMRAPDGVTTHSVSRDSLRGRSGRNSRAYFQRWLNRPSDEQRVEIKHECRQCDRAFSDRYGLAAHAKSHIRPTECPVCGKSVKYIERHMKFHEPKPLSEMLLELAARAERMEKHLEEMEGDGHDDV